VVIDRSLVIRKIPWRTWTHLVLAVCLVILVIFLSCEIFSATVIPSLALPMSIVGKFAAWRC